MLLNSGEGTALILQDDHGEIWRVGLERPGAIAGTGRLETGRGRPRAIRFIGPDDEPLRVLYEGPAEIEQELTLDDVVIHFLKAQD